MSNLITPFVSIIIPVFNDSERLKTCLSSLESQTYPKSLYKVIVVDNGSEDDIKGVVSQFGQALLTHEDRPGSYAARNKGIALAKGDIVAFTDSDCIPASDWVDKGVVNLLLLPNCGLVAGKIELFFKDPQNPTAVELFESSMYNFPQKKFIEEKRCGVTANLFTFKSVIEDVGCFDEELKSGGDLEWGQRVFSAGYKQIYADDTCVAHPARHSLGQLFKRVTRVVGGKHDLKKKKGYPVKEFIKDLAMYLLPPFKAYPRVFSNESLNGNKQKIQVIFVLVLVRYLKAWELVRLQLGGKSTRG